MGIMEALEIEKITPVKNGVYICVNAEKKIFKLVKPEELPVALESKETMTLGVILEDIYQEISQLKEKHNSLIEILMQNSEEVR